MIHETIDLSGDGRVTLVTYLHEDYDEVFSRFQPKSRPAIIVLPGGAYGFLSEREGEPVALTFLKEGFQTFVLNYSVGDFSVFPNPLDDISKAIWEVRRRAKEWHIDPDAIIPMGFSAGAGVAALAATQWNTPGLAERLGIPEGGNKPNGAVLGYGAARNSTITDDPEAYQPPFLGKIAKDRTPQLEFPDYVGPHTPPLFIWCTRYDKYVPLANKLMMAQAMQDFDLPYELHIFQHGQHGMSVSNQLSAYGDPEHQNPSVAQWVPLCVSWLQQQFLF